MRGLQKDAAAPAVEISIHTKDAFAGFEPRGAGAGVETQQAIPARVILPAVGFQYSETETRERAQPCREVLVPVDENRDGG